MDEYLISRLRNLIKFNKQIFLLGFYKLFHSPVTNNCILIVRMMRIAYITCCKVRQGISLSLPSNNNIYAIRILAI